MSELHEALVRAHIPGYLLAAEIKAENLLKLLQIYLYDKLINELEHVRLYLQYLDRVQPDYLDSSEA